VLPEAADPKCPLFRRYGRESRRDVGSAERAFLTPLRHGWRPSLTHAVLCCCATLSRPGCLARKRAAMRRREFVIVVGGTVLLARLLASRSSPASSQRLGISAERNRSKAIGSPRLYVALANSAGSKAAPSPSKFAGQEVVQSALPRLQLSSCGRS
jgi:hypothetical protein